MKRLLVLSIMAAIIVAALAVIGFRSSSGTDVADAQGAAKLEIDVDVTDGTGPCNPVTDSADHYLGTTYEVAVCLTDAVAPNEVPKAFQFDLEYDDTLNTCVPVDCDEDDEIPGVQGKCLDSNPDANEGTSVSSTPDLGAGWNCNASEVDPPLCDKDPTSPAGVAYISCYSTIDGTLPVGTGVSSPVAVVTFTAGTTAGMDNLTLNNAAVYGPPGEALSCFPDGPCYGAADNKTEPPTPTPLPAACDISDESMTADDTSISMKVGDPPAIVNVSETIKNLGGYLGSEGQACDLGLLWGVSETTDGTDFYPIGAGLNVRMEPSAGAGPGAGDICIACDDPSLPIAVCAALGTHGYVGCDESPGFIPYMALAEGSCENGVDDDDPVDGTCDWGGFSLLCDPATTPDPDCTDIYGLLITPLSPISLDVDEEATTERELKIECVERGTYTLVAYASMYGQRDVGVEYNNEDPPPIKDPNPANDTSAVILQVTCTKGPEMVKDCSDAEGIQTNCTLWIMNPKFEGGIEPFTDPPVTLPPADDNGCVLPEDGKGCLSIDIWLKSADDEDDANDDDLIPECLGAWEHQMRFDHKLIRFVREFDPEGWLESEGRIANCTISVLGEDWILEGCVTKDDPEEEGMQLGPCGDGIIERITIVPNTNDLMFRGVFRPTKDNGLVTDIVDDNCEITDIFGEPMADTLPGQLTPICGDLHITIRMLEGDTDLDCDVDVLDDQAVAFRYGAQWGMLLYNEWFDLEGPLMSLPDGDIDIKDLQFVFGRNYSTCQAPIPEDQDDPVPPAQPDP